MSTTQGGGVPSAAPRPREQKKVCRKTNDGREVRYSSYRLWFPESLVRDVGALGRGFDTDRFCVWQLSSGRHAKTLSPQTAPGDRGNQVPCGQQQYLHSHWKLGVKTASVEVVNYELAISKNNMRK